MCCRAEAWPTHPQHRALCSQVNYCAASACNVTSKSTTAVLTVVNLALFVQTFVADAGKTAAMLAYDRPSPKLKAFLAKHYGERTPLPALLSKFAGMISVGIASCLSCCTRIRIKREGCMLKPGFCLCRPDRLPATNQQLCGKLLLRFPCACTVIAKP